MRVGRKRTNNVIYNKKKIFFHFKNREYWPSLCHQNFKSVEEKTSELSSQNIANHNQEREISFEVPFNNHVTKSESQRSV